MSAECLLVRLCPGQIWRASSVTLPTLAFIVLRWEHGRILSSRVIGCELGSKRITPDASWVEVVDAKAGRPVRGLVSGVGQAFDGVCGLPPWFLLMGCGEWGRGVLSGAGTFFTGAGRALSAWTMPVLVYRCHGRLQHIV